MEQVISNKRNIASRYFPNQNGTSAGKAILCIHGWQSRQDRMWMLAEKLNMQGYAVLTFDLSGHGASGGDIQTLSRADFLEDVVAAYDALKKESNADSIYVIGSSFGSYLATLLSAERTVGGLVLRVPADYPDEGFSDVHIKNASSDEKFPWRNQARNFDGTRSLRALHMFQKPALIVESELDDVTPHQCIQNYANAVTDISLLTHTVQKHAPHSLTAHPELQNEYESIVCAWFAEISAREKKFWFKRKTYGWGWQPSTREGWAVVLVHILAVVIGAYVIETYTRMLWSDITRVSAIVGWVGVCSALLVYIAYKKGPSPRWQWGVTGDGTGAQPQL
ncbi:MAG: hypothetical protein RI911_729 [Candidatus Parcubacteria bacterium]